MLVLARWRWWLWILLAKKTQWLAPSRIRATVATAAPTNPPWRASTPSMSPSPVVRSARVPLRSTWGRVRVPDIIPQQLDWESLFMSPSVKDVTETVCALMFLSVDYINGSLTSQWLLCLYYIVAVCYKDPLCVFKETRDKPFLNLQYLLSLCCFLKLYCLFLSLYWMLSPLLSFLSPPSFPPSLLLLDRDLMVSVLSLERPLPSAVISCFLGSLLGTHYMCCMGDLCVHVDSVCVFFCCCCLDFLTNFPLQTCFTCVLCVICLSALNWI